MKAQRAFHGLKRYRKRLLGPFSAMGVTGKGAPIVHVSWSDDASAELLWLCCLIYRHGFGSCLPLISAIAQIGRTKSMIDRSGFLFFSNLQALSDDDLDALKREVSDAELVRTFLRLFSFFSVVFRDDLSLWRETEGADTEMELTIEDLRQVVRLAINKEHPLPLKAMALFVKCEIESDALHIAGGLIDKINPWSLDDYPNSLESKMCAGFLRSHMNAVMLAPGQNRARFCEKLWPALTTLEECE